MACLSGSKSFLLRGRALNPPLFLISNRILSSVDMGSSCTLLLRFECKFNSIGTVTYFDTLLCLPEAANSSGCLSLLSLLNICSTWTFKGTKALSYYYYLSTISIFYRLVCERLNGYGTVIPALVAVRFRPEAFDNFLSNMSLRLFFVGPVSLRSLNYSGCVTYYLIV